MSTVTSKDGTQVAYDATGSGPALVIVSAMPDRSANAQLVELLAPYFTVYNYDRRERGGTKSDQPYAVAREFEDLEAVLGAAGGSAYIYGSSGMGVFALRAAANGLAGKLQKIAVWEPPFIVEGARQPLPGDYKQQLEKMLSEDRRGDMAALFMTAAVGMPAEFVEPMKGFPNWSAFEASAPALIHDAEVVGDMSIPDELKNVTVPTLILEGGSIPWVTAGIDALVKILPQAERKLLAGQQHNVEATAIAPALIEFFK